MKVYRIEHQTRGVGPYQGNAPGNFEYFADRHPSPYQDGISPDWHFFYGFASMRQMFQWFNWFDVFKWKRHGFRVYKYQISDDKVQVGNRQVAFVKSAAAYRHEVRMAQLAKHLIRIPMLSS